MGEVGQRHASVALAPGNRPGSHSKGICVGLGQVWMVSENTAPAEFDLKTVQPVGNRYKNLLSRPSVCFFIYSVNPYVKDDHFLNCVFSIRSNKICEGCQIFLSFTSLRICPETYIPSFISVVPIHLYSSLFMLQLSPRRQCRIR
jgi:hypothetical protein